MECISADPPSQGRRLSWVYICLTPKRSLSVCSLCESVGLAGGGGRGAGHTFCLVPEPLSSCGRGLHITHQERGWALASGPAGHQCSLSTALLRGPEPEATLLLASVFSSVKDTMLLSCAPKYHEIMCGSSWHMVGVLSPFPTMV